MSNIMKTMYVEKYSGTFVKLGRFSLSRKKLYKILRNNDWNPVYTKVYEKKGNDFLPFRLNLIQFFQLFFFSHVYQIKSPDRMVLYPFATRSRNLVISYRSDNGMTKSKRFRQFWAYFLATIMNTMFPMNRPMIVYEKLSDRAQESGYAYFKYMNKYHAKEPVYFLIKLDSPDIDKLYGLKNIVVHGSFKHFYLLIRSKLFISSETPGHAYFWRENMGLTANVVRTKPYVFLQHGVLGFKKLDNLFYGDRLTAPVRLITSSQFEQDIVTKQLGYDASRAPITGLARWDLIDLPKERMNVRDKILFFYTWRPWLDDVDDETFVQSEYFLAIKKSIKQISKLSSDKKIIVMMHPKMHAALNSSDMLNIKLWTDNDGPLNELMSSVALLVTDYSSLSWEAYYREIPVVFNMFDKERYEKEVDSYINLDEMPFGINGSGDLSFALAKAEKQNFHLRPEELLNKSKYFAYEDQGASERIHEVVQNIDLKSINRDKRRSMIQAILRLIRSN